MKKVLLFIAFSMMLFVACQNQPTGMYNALSVTDETLLKANEFYTKSNDYVYTSFEKISKDSGNVKMYYEKVLKAKELTLKFGLFLNTIKDSVISKVDNVAFSDTLKASNLSNKGEVKMVEEIMFAHLNAKALKDSMDSFRRNMLALVDEQGKQFIDSKLALTTDSIPAAEGKKIAWTDFYFKKNPAIGVVTLITKFQIDGKQAESLIINDLYQKAMQAKK